MVDEALLDKDQVAKALGVRVSYVQRLVRERRLAHHKVGRLLRFRPSDVAAFIAAGRVDAQ